MEWFKGFFEAGKDQSSKRLMGITSGIGFILVCMADTLHMFEVSQWVAYSLAGYSAACLGITTIDALKHKKDEEI
jgi:hypothetical protein